MTDAELLQEHKKAKMGAVNNAVLIGVFFGIAVYSLFRNGLSFFTFFPLIMAFFLFHLRDSHDALKKELKSRNLN